MILTRRRPTGAADTATATAARTDEPDGFVRRRELEALFKGVYSELKWVRWLALATLTVSAAPKLGAPSVPQVAALLVERLT